MEIRTADLTRVYRLGSSEIVAINGVNIEVGEATFVAVVGRSGSGKSTLLNLIGLNDYPTSGKILLDGEDVSRVSAGKRRKIRLSRMGFVFQSFNLLPTLNVLENVELPMTLAGVPSGKQWRKALSLIEAVGLEKRCFHRPKQLSLGEMQRVAIARALANSPEVLIADEPTGELDSTTAHEIIQLLFMVNKEKRATVIVATHDEKLIKDADTTYAIEDGKLKVH